MITTAESLVPVPSVELTDKAWQKIVEGYGLPSEARDSINCAISFIGLAYGTNYSPFTTKNALRDLADLSSDLRRGLEKLTGDPLALLNLTRSASANEDFDGMNDRLAHNILAAEIAALKQLESLFENATKTIVKARPGAHSRAVIVAMFVQLLDDIHFKFKGQFLTRDSKGPATGPDFVAAISGAAGVKLTPGSIDEALRQIMKGRGGISGSKNVNFPAGLN